MIHICILKNALLWKEEINENQTQEGWKKEKSVAQMQKYSERNTFLDTVILVELVECKLLTKRYTHTQTCGLLCFPPTLHRINTPLTLGNFSQKSSSSHRSTIDGRSHCSLPTTVCWVPRARVDTGGLLWLSHHLWPASSRHGIMLVP